MEAVVRHSVLNPLATCFVPSNLLKTECKDICKEIKNENEDKLKEATAICLNILEKSDDQNEEPDTVPCCPSETKDLVSAPKMLNESIDHESMAFDLRNEDKDSWSTTDIIAFLEFLLLIMYSFYSRKNISSTLDIDDSHEKRPDSLKKSKCDDCNCPPIFGYIIPPNFFGNPFNLNLFCKKKYIHTSHFVAEEEFPKVIKCNNRSNQSLDLEGKTTLEQYSFELGEIVKDVCETISIGTDDCVDLQSDSSANQSSDDHGHRSRLSSTTIEDVDTETWKNKIPPIGTKIPSKKYDYSKDEDLMETPKDLQIIGDDDLHSLLNEDIDQTDNNEGVPADVEKMIKAALSPKPGPLLDPETLSENTTCNPPCSIWCDSVPKSTRESYRKFVKGFTDPEEAFLKSVSAEEPLKQKSLFRKPLYKRSFSANDCVKRSDENLAHMQSCFDAESRENLLLLRRDPVSYFKSQSSSHALKSGSNSQLSALAEDVFYYHLNESQSASRRKHQSSMWGPFDGADSLWQPLPDCVPSNEHSKSNHRKAREMKRQRSVN